MEGEGIMQNVHIRNTIEKLANAFRDRPCGEEVLTMNKLYILCPWILCLHKPPLVSDIITREKPNT